MDDKVLIDNWDSYIHGAEKTAQRKFVAGQKVNVKVEYRCDDNRWWRSLRLGHLPPVQ